jgi:hypothetical protein
MSGDERAIRDLIVRSGYTLTILCKNSDDGWVITQDANLLAPDKTT